MVCRQKNYILKLQSLKDITLVVLRVFYLHPLEIVIDHFFWDFLVHLVLSIGGGSAVCNPKSVVMKLLFLDSRKPNVLNVENPFFRLTTL